MTDLMRALVIDRTGDADELHLAHVPMPVRVLDEVLVRVIAAGVNPVDAKTRRGGHGVARAISSYPAVLGWDFAGVVEQVPYAMHPLKVGDRVYGMQRVPRVGGTNAEFTAVTSLSIAPMPTTLSFVEAAAVPLAALTAWGAVVDIGRVHDGQRVLVHAGAGGVGHFAVQFARYFGAVVTATASARNAAFVESLGAHRVIDYRAQRFEEVAGEQDVVIDLIGNLTDDTATRSLEVLRRDGLLVTVPSAAAAFGEVAEEAARRGIRSTGYIVSPDARTLAIITRLIDDGAVRVHVDRELPLEAGAEAHRLIEDGHVRGKLVLRVAPDPD